MQKQTLSVTQLNAYIQALVDKDAFLGSVAVRGEISNYKVYPSGHHYFTLKDEGAALKCVMFRSNSVRLKFHPENGMKVIALGKISVYPRDGAYQLYCSSMAMDGVGDLYAAFEQLKAKLAAKGMFDQDHKKTLPQFPDTIGIITSSAGAAVHDMLRIIKKRYPLTQVKILPVRVQGAEAPPEIAAAIRYANQYNLADLLIVGRGGGSIEDLWAFNDERVASAIYESRIPVISAVGHEPDVTISDYVADIRAATPSNAAEIAVPDQNALQQYLDTVSETVTSALMRQISTERKHLSILADAPVLCTPTQYLSQRRKALNHITDILTSAQLKIINRNKQSFISQTAKLDAMNPLKVLMRGYSMVQKCDGQVVSSTHNLKADDLVTITMHDGTVNAQITEIKEAGK